MKKNIIKNTALMIVFSVVLSMSASAAVEYEKGDISLGGSLSLSYPLLGLWRGEFDMKDHTDNIVHDAKLGGLSLGLAFQGVYFLTDHLAAGLHVSNILFPRKLASGFELDVRTNIFNLMFLTRLYFNPKDRIKYYIPLAIGIADIRTEVDMAKIEQFQDLGFAALIGFGAEYPFKKNSTIGWEMSYNHNTFHDKKVNSEGHLIEIYPRANYFALSLKLSRLF